jgi:hypothetical protein
VVSEVGVWWVVQVHKQYSCFRGIRNNLHGCCIKEPGFSDPSGEVTSAGHAVLIERPFEQPKFRGTPNAPCLSRFVRYLATEKLGAGVQRGSHC